METVQTWFIILLCVNEISLYCNSSCWQYTSSAHIHWWL